MANAKTYNDLNQATEVNDTDKLALAQSDKQELVTATVGQVAQKVANIVSTDQVTEVITDLGLGKQVMAQKLQDKGLDVTAADTLTTMANKVDGLDVVGAKEYQQAIPCKAGYISSAPHITAILCGSLNKFITIDVTGGVLSIGSMNNSKTIDVEMTITDTRITKFTTSLYPAVGTSNNHQYIALVNTNSAVKTLLVYKLDWTQKTIEFVYEHTYSTTTNDSMRGVYITNDGEKVFAFVYGSYGDTLKYYNHATDTEILTGGSVSTSHIVTYGGYLDEENNKFLFPGSYGSTNERWGLASVAYTITDSTVTLGSPVAIVSAPSSSSDVYAGDVSIIVKDMDLLITNGRAGSTDYYYSDFKLKVFKISTGELLSTLVYNRFQFETYTYGGTTFIAWKNNDKLYVGTGVGLLVSVATDGTITDEIGTPDINGKMQPMYAFNVQNSYTIGISGYNINGNFIAIVPAFSYNGWTSYLWTTYQYPSIIYKKCVIGNWYKRNNQQVLQKIRWSDADYEAGAYDIDNTKAEVEI